MKRIKRRKNSSFSYFISVDIQPEYEKSFQFDIKDWICFLNKTSYPLIFLYNGYETLGMIKEQDYKYWLLENGLKRKIINNSIFYDKGYAFFRYCIDFKINEKLIIDFVRFLYLNNINDSRELTLQNWNKFHKQFGKKGSPEKEIRNLLEFSDDLVYIPDLMNFLNDYNNLLITGGGVNECLKEVEITLSALRKNYKVYEEFTY